MRRGFDYDMDDLWPPPFSAQCWHAAPTECQLITSLAPAGNSQRWGTMERGYFNLGAQGCLGKGNGDLTMNLCTVTLKELVGSHMDDDVEITGRPAVTPFLPFTRQAQARPIIDSSGNLDGEFFGELHYTDAATFRTRVSDPHPFSTASGAGGAQHKNPLPPFDLPQAAAGVTGDRTLTWSRALPQAVDTRFELFKFQDFLCAKHGFLEGQLHVIP